MGPANTATSSFSGGGGDFRPRVKKRLLALFKNSNVIQVPKRGGSFAAELLDDGIDVDNLGADSFLEWEAFYEAVNAVD